MAQYAAACFCLILAALTMLQLALAAGAPLGHLAWGGQHRVLPARLRVGSLAAIAIYAIFALVILDGAGLIAWVADPVSSGGAWVIAALSLFGAAANLASRSRAERLIMVPVSLFLGASSLLVALAG